jgi:hypothetical protein
MKGYILPAVTFIGYFLMVRHRVRALRSQPQRTPEQTRIFWAGNAIAFGLLASMFYMLSLDHRAIPAYVFMLVGGFFLAGIAVTIVQRKFAG